MTMSATVNGNDVDYRARTFNSERRHDNGCGTFSNGNDAAFMNGRTDRESNNAPRFHVTGSTASGHNNSVQR